MTLLVLVSVNFFVKSHAFTLIQLNAINLRENATCTKNKQINKKKVLDSQREITLWGPFPYTQMSLGRVD